MTEQPGLICRNCGNTGVDMQGEPCACLIGRAMVSEGEWAQRYRKLQGFSATVTAPLSEEALRAFDQWLATARSTPPDPRAIVQHFASLGMEAKLRRNDHKGGWKHDNWTSLFSGLDMERDELLAALTKRQKVLMALDGLTVEWENGALLSQTDRSEEELLKLLDEANAALLEECADVANFAMMIADVCDALPKTDERGH